MWHDKFSSMKHAVRIFTCFMLAAIGLTTLPNTTSAEEIYGMLRWRKGGDRPIVVGDRGFYLRNVNGQLGFGEYSYAKSVGELLGIEDDQVLLPDEIIVVITNNDETPLHGCEVDIVATNIYSPHGHYIIDHFIASDPFGMRLVENPKEANWYRPGWRIFDGVQSDGKFTLYTLDGTERMVFHSHLNGRATQIWRPLDNKDDDILECYFTPLPLPHRVVPKLVLNRGEQAIGKLAAQGLMPKFLPGYTHDPAVVGHVLQQFPEG